MNRLHMTGVALLVGLALVTAGRADASAPTASKAAPAKSSAKNVTEKTAPAPKMVLPFIEDDYAKALQVARAKHLPIFIESWAPW